MGQIVERTLWVDNYSIFYFNFRGRSYVLGFRYENVYSGTDRGRGYFYLGGAASARWHGQAYLAGSGEGITCVLSESFKGTDGYSLPETKTDTAACMVAHFARSTQLIIFRIRYRDW